MAAGILVWFFLYESRCLSLENVDLMYGQDDLKPWTSSKWVPPGYITREQRDETVFRNMSVSAPSGDAAATAAAAEPMEKKSSDASDGVLAGEQHKEHV